MEGTRSGPRGGFCAAAEGPKTINLNNISRSLGIPDKGSVMEFVVICPCPYIAPRQQRVNIEKIQVVSQVAISGSDLGQIFLNIWITPLGHYPKILQYFWRIGLDEGASG